MNNEISELRQLIADLEKRISALEAKGSIGIVETPLPQNTLASLAKKINLPMSKLFEVYDLEAKSLTVLKCKGQSVKEKTQCAALFVLLGYKYAYNTEEVLAQEIRRNVKENLIPLDNFGTYLADLLPTFIRRKGKNRSPQTEYRLTPNGEERAVELLAHLLGQGNSPEFGTLRGA